MKLHRFSRFLARPRNALARSLSQWFTTPKGQLLDAMERQLLEPQLARHFGSFIVYYNPPAGLAQASSLRHQISIGDRQLAVEVHCAEDKWPIAADSIDVVVLQHSLDFSVSPHAVLREAAQCVRPGGHLIIIGAHAWSLFGVYRYFTRSVWKHAYCLPPARITDWLAVLGFTLEKRSFAAYQPLLTAPALQSKLSGLERYGMAKKLPLGGCYMLVARKMVHGVHPQAQSSKIRVQTLRPNVVAAQTTHQSNFKHSEEHDR
ncbi:MAG: methyltransferase domain-containing protein [Pseudomonas sp.]|nr:methyltransferase domain-containing protein [Pseudomonas sp.]